MKIRTTKLSILNRLICWVSAIPGISLFVKYVFHIENPCGAIFRMPHPFCIVVNGNAEIGKNVTIYQFVTLGSSQIGRRAGVPSIGDDVIIYPNNVIIGSVKIGNGAIVGAGSVVVSDIPPGAICAGNPAKVIRYQDVA